MRPLLLTPGCPQGIGAEVAVRALLSEPRARPVVMVGAPEPVVRAAKRAGATLTLVDDLVAAPHGLSLCPTHDGDEPAEIVAIRMATAACLAGEADALITGPIHKGRLVQRGFGFTGHTDLLGHLTGVPRPVMAFTGGSLRVALVTVHLPLRRVADAVTTDLVLHTLRTAHAALSRQLGIVEPRLLVCGLNPHAGDDGALGDEERTVIGPAVEAARADGIDAVGPMSAEAAFLRATQGYGDMVVAMYHDQGLAPLKAVDFGRSVNWTLGLPIIRTSVDHGTADDLVGTDRADPSSMIAAIDLAERLANGAARLDSQTKDRDTSNRGT